MTGVVSVDGVTHGHDGGAGPTRILSGVTFHVGAGEIVALVGPSGSGKSSLCHLVAGLEDPWQGHVVVDGRRATSVRDWAVVSFLPQRLGLAPQLTVAENALLLRWIRGKEPPAALLHDLELSALRDQRAGDTSLGEQQRAGIARALALQPRVVVLDEPTGHQDDANTDRVCSALRSAARRGCAVLVATHDEAVTDAATRVLRLDDGRIV